MITETKTLAELKEIADYAERVRHENAIEDALNELVEIDRYAAPEATAAPVPASISFEHTECRRCDGLGRNRAWGLSNNHCYACKGEGVFFTEAGKAARDAYDAYLTVLFVDVKIGEDFRFQGTDKIWTKAEEIERHNDRLAILTGKENKAEAMAAVAHLPGATVTF